MDLRLVTFEHRDPNADVLVVTNGWPHESDPAYCIFVKRQVQSLRAAGLRCDVLFIRGYRSFAAYVVGALALLAMSLRRRRYCVVHAHSGEAAMAATCYLRAPVVASYLGDDLLGRPRPDGSVSRGVQAKRELVRQHSRLLAQTITKTLEMQAALPPRVRNRNVVIPNGIDSSVFRPQPRDRVRQRLGWDGAPVVLFVANLSSPAQVARKRPWLVIEAVELARQTVPDIRLEIVSNVAPEDVPLLMNAADCLVLASSVEGSPNVVKEALMCNLPVVATDVGDVSDLLAGVEPSRVVEASPEAIAAALVDQLRERRRSNGRSRVRHLDSAAVASRLFRLYGAYGVMRPQASPMPGPLEAAS
jgi:teichuronic acid biosynthesis glycosyltransferase TuaC